MGDVLAAKDISLEVNNNVVAQKFSLEVSDNLGEDCRDKVLAGADEVLPKGNFDVVNFNVELEHEGNVASVTTEMMDAGLIMTGNSLEVSANVDFTEKSLEVGGGSGAFGGAGMLVVGEVCGPYITNGLSAGVELENLDASIEEFAGELCFEDGGDFG